MKEGRVTYPGRDLEAMDFAENYHEWIWEMFGPFAGRDVVEVGAGSGSFSKLILRSSPASLSLIEPSGMFGSLERTLAAVRTDTKLRLFDSTFAEAAAKIAEEGPPDTIIYVNVLEHVEHDEEELRIVYRTLRPGGHVCIFVPAMPSLFSRYDRHLGHFRRYSLSEMKTKCELAGFKISLARRMDLPGVLPWLVKYRIMRSMSMETWAVRLYDRTVVPVTKRLEHLIHPPIGKNVIVVGEKV
jgi:SAM-dependent methyltransferase